MKTLIWKYFLFSTIFLCCNFTWGFFAHRHINELAVYILPPQMIGFFKAHIDYLIERSVAPDRRRYAIKEEAPRHYIDLDLYGDSVMHVFSWRWDEAVKRIGKDTLMARGTVPWHVYRMYLRLREAFLLRDPAAILRISAELGHYASDANVPLHTTRNYNGQLTGQVGIHALWESRLPELFFGRYDFFVGKAYYIADVQVYVWKNVRQAHRAVDSVLQLEKQLEKQIGNQKYGFKTRGTKTVKMVSERYATRYHSLLNGMVERRMRASVKMIGDLWYTAWVDAGQPNLDTLIAYRPSEDELSERRKELELWRSRSVQPRDH